VDKRSHFKQHNLVRALQKLVNSKPILASITSISAITYVLLLIFGVKNNYSGVPFWDEWNGRIKFVLDFNQSTFGSIFSLHNEHRIVLYRIISLMVFYLGSDQIWIFICINLLILSLVVQILVKFISLAVTLKGNFDKYTLITVVSTLTIVEFSWMQEQNITWAFQSQFLLGIYLPLLSFYFIVKHWLTNRNIWFYLALALGIFSAAAFASGVLALPIIAVFSIFLRRNIREIITLTVTSLIILFLYFNNFSTPGQHVNPIETFFKNPLSFIKYLGVYLLAPTIKILGESNPFLISIIGVLIVALIFGMYYQMFHEKKQLTGLNIFLLPVTYLLGMAVLTSLGRANFGAREALASRYTSVTLVLYVFIIIFALSKLSLRIVFAPKYQLLFFVIFISLLLPTQIQSIKQNDQVFEHRLSALSLNLGLQDDDQVRKIFSSPDFLYGIAPRYIVTNSGIFGTKFFLESRTGGKIQPEAFSLLKCEVRVDKIYPQSGDGSLKVFGWAYVSKMKQGLGDFLVIDADRTIVGAGLSGVSRPDVDSYLGLNNSEAGFAFYATKPIDGMTIVNTDRKVGCKLPKTN